MGKNGISQILYILNAMKCRLEGDVEMRKMIFLVIFLCAVFLATASLASVSAMPIIRWPMELIEATIEGGGPVTVDPACAFDSPSCDLVQNVYDTLVTSNGERFNEYLPSAATDWTIDDITGAISPEGVPWYYRYTFTMRSGMRFSNGYAVTPADVEYSFEREMIMDYPTGPQWMLYEPLLNSAGAALLGDIGDAANPGPDVALVGKMIDHAVESTSTHVIFFLAHPGGYAPFMKILCQTWSSILSRQWGRNIAGNWGGDWMLNGDHTDWINYWRPEVSPLDTAGNVMLGSGPFFLESLSYASNLWAINRSLTYWRGWPVGFPSMLGSKPAGYAYQYVCYFGLDWPTRKAMFLAGDVDFIQVPSQYFGEILGQPGVRCMYPLPSLTLDAFTFNFDIALDSPYGPITSPGAFSESSIPSDFFGNTDWGIHVRKAFAWAFNYDAFLATGYQDSGFHPATVIVPGLAYYSAEIAGYTYNLANAVAEFLQVPGLWSTGFTLTLPYNSVLRQTVSNLLKTAIESLNPKFHVMITSADGLFLMHSYLDGKVPALSMGWIVDYPDPHDVAFAYYDSNGVFSKATYYHNDAMDGLIEQGLETLDGSERATCYEGIQQLAISDCPSFAIGQQYARHFERDWVVGWYYNPTYWRHYVANVWKWYYVEEALQDTAAQPYSNRLPCDVNYDGYVDMRDVGTVSRCFGAQYGPPIDSRWLFRADINNDRKIDMRDIGFAAKALYHESPIWTP